MDGRLRRPPRGRCTAVPSLATLLRRRPIQWALVYEIGRDIYANARDRVRENLSQRERDELRDLIARSRGRPGRLSARERRRFTSLTRKAATGDADAGWARFAAAVASLLPPRALGGLLRRRR